MVHVRDWKILGERGFMLVYAGSSTADFLINRVLNESSVGYVEPRRGCFNLMERSAGVESGGYC